MSNIILFQFESNEIRFVGTAENPEWIAADVCKALGLGNVSMALSRLKSGEKGIISIDSGVGTPLQLLTINETGLYRLIFSSRKAVAERMKDWVFSEVLPSIRKTGAYSVTPQPVEQPKLRPDKLAVEVSESIVTISDNLRNNPRLAQILIDHAMNSIIDERSLPAQEFPEDKWYGLVQIADKIGVKTDASSRVKLGQYISRNFYFDRVKEERLCNGQQMPIWCYRDTPEIRAAIQDWAAKSI
jgi:prophage antirepressor-like protein